jgi:hypothetical protein
MADTRGVKRKKLGEDSYVDSNYNSGSTYITVPEFQIDIVCDKKTERKFMETYGNSATITGSTDDFNTLIRKVVLERPYEISIETDISIDDPSPIDDEESPAPIGYPQCGNRVSVSYIPASQKYIDHYDAQAFEGEVFFVDEENDNFFMWNVEIGPLTGGQIKLTYRVQSYRREGCHFFGMTDCYFGDYRFV